MQRDDLAVDHDQDLAVAAEEHVVGDGSTAAGGDGQGREAGGAAKYLELDLVVVDLPMTDLPAVLVVERQPGVARQVEREADPQQGDDEKCGEYSGERAKRVCVTHDSS